MRVRMLTVVNAPLVASVFVGLVTQVGLTGQTATGTQSDPSLRTPWGEPDLQGIWTDEFDTPLERSERYGNRAYLTEEEQAELDEQRAGRLSGQQNADGDRRGQRGSERDVAGAYSNVFLSFKHISRRTSLIVDPPNGRRPPLTDEAQARATADREFRLALLRSTDTCRNGLAACAGGEYDPTPSVRLNLLLGTTPLE